MPPPAVPSPAPRSTHRAAALVAEGKACCERSDWAGARRHFAAAAGHPSVALEAEARLADTLARMEDWTGSAQHWRTVLASRPTLAAARTGLAKALLALGETDAALDEFRRAVADNPTLAATHFNLGTGLLATDQPSAAIDAFHEAVRLAPDHREARWNLALALLKAGRFKDGALAYESRWQAAWRGKERPFSGPRWDGRPLPAGRSLLLWGEQGIGDEIMFAGLVGAAVRAAGPAAVVLECAPRLVPLFARAYPMIRVIARVNPPSVALPADAAQAPLGALPGLLWPDEGAPEPPAAYLQADPPLVARMRAQLDEFGRGPKIGLAWRGGHPAAQRPRFIPPAAWTALLQRPDLVPVCLQHGPDPAELSALGQVAGRQIHQLPDADPLVDLDAFAALLAALDGVVSVDNSTVHLAGALGRPALILLGPESDWRWGVDGVACPWYRSVRRTRQQKPGDWAAPMQAAVMFVDTLLPVH